MEHLLLEFDVSGKSYVNPRGDDCTEIDYFLKPLANDSFGTKIVLKDIATNCSDHYPIAIAVYCSFTKAENKKEVKCYTPRIKWDKIDKEEYAAMITQNLHDLKFMDFKDPTSFSKFIISFMEVIKNTMMNFKAKPKKLNSKPKLRVWNKDISEALQLLRKSYKAWNAGGRPWEPNDPRFYAMKLHKKLFRSKCRIERARRKKLEQEEILNTRFKDPKLFNKLVNKQKCKSSDDLDSLHVNGVEYSGTASVIDGFYEHFQTLAVESEAENFDSEYHKMVEEEIIQIQEIVSDKKVNPVSMCELKNAICSINVGKATDFYDLSIESIKFGGEDLHVMLLQIINSIFDKGDVPSVLKIGVLSPVYKNKGPCNDVSNYRCITVLPVIVKIIESILKQRIAPLIDICQSPYQRGFTKNTSPLHAAIIVEEIARNSKDDNIPIDFIFLDAKSAFDVVSHDHLLRRMYQIGIQDKHWALLKSLHEETSSVVKWHNRVTDVFNVKQGVRQGGVLSADLYKVYVNPLLKTLEATETGSRIGTVRCNASACADDITLNSSLTDHARVLISTAEQFSNMERYTLQPKKTEALRVHPRKSGKNNLSTGTYTVYNNEIKNVKSSTHLGIKRSVTISATSCDNVDNNISKARRTVYSFMPSGLHGHNGLDLCSMLHLIQLYVSPVLTYGLEVIFPKKTDLERLEKYQRRLLKHILSIPNNTTDSAVYILSGFLPVEAQIHKKALVLFNNICLQNDQSVEKAIAKRQLCVKSMKSNSWFIEIKTIFWLYHLPNIDGLLEHPIQKLSWKKTVNKVVNEYWKDQILSLASYSKSLKFLNCELFQPGKPHPLVRIPLNSSHDITRFPVKLKIASGTYILQSNRAVFNQNQINPVCLMCNEESETLEHFILRCDYLQPIRQPIVCDIEFEFNSLQLKQQWCNLVTEEKLQVIIDCTHLFHGVKLERLAKLEFQCKRLICALHSSRYRQHTTINKPKRKYPDIRASGEKPP
ncbi:uncharacterized protein LOC123558082 [Mercenaria mercenaria]|uniref:uncharacterized protein LOC123558082 n=1 Tax=Mercenaria mercenaria TaxID=6596 RepID=UPI00234F8CA7|nr:uncharacterized protein LOC123558082 [Mercenaria mercenaria]